MTSLSDAIYRDRILRARQMPAATKFSAGWTLFEEGCDRMRAGIRLRYPQASPAEIEKQLKTQLARLRQVEEHGIYQKLTR